jgi:hypothetical protein
MYRLVIAFFVLVPFFAHSQTPVITLAPTQHTEGWIFFEDSTKKILLRLDSLAMEQEESKRTLKTDSVWIYRNAKTYRLIFNIEIDTINNARAYLVTYNESFAKMDMELYNRFHNLSYYQRSAVITPNPYLQSRYLQKASKNLKIAGALTLLEIAGSFISVSNTSNTGKAIGLGLSLTGLASIPMFIISASQLKKARNTRFR